jgi:hypothetical protein
MATVPGQERSAVGGIHTIRNHNKVTSTMRNTKKIKLRRAIQNKRCGMLTYGVVPLHDNARPHTAANFSWKSSDNLPYKPDLAPSDCHMFTYMKTWLTSQRFNNNEELMEAVVKTWLSYNCLTQACKNLFPDTSVSIPAVTTLRSSLSMYVSFVYHTIFSPLLVLLAAHRRLLSELYTILTD